MDASVHTDPTTSRMVGTDSVMSRTDASVHTDHSGCVREVS